MIKNVAGQKIAVFAWDSGVGAPKTGDAPNITAQISLDGGASAPTNDTNPTELDASNHPGLYIFDPLQAETNADLVVITPVSSTSGVVFKPVVAYPTTLTPTKSGYLNASLSDILADTVEIGAAGAGLTALGDTRIANLDAQVSTRSTLTAQQVWEYTTRTLSSFGTLVADIATAVWGAVTRSLTDKAGFTISGTKTTLDALQDLSEAGAQAGASTALVAYDPPTRAEATSDKDEIIAAMPGETDLTALTDLVTRVLGLAGENMVMDETVFDGDKKLTSARIRIYDSAVNALAAGDTGLIATFPLTMTWATKLLETMTQVKL